MKTTIIAICLAVIFLIVAIFFGCEWSKESTSKVDITQSNTSLFQELKDKGIVMQQLKTKDSLSEITIDRVLSDYKTVQSYASYESKRAEDAGLKLKYIQSLSIISDSSNTKIDSSKIVYTVQKDSIRLFNYEDNFSYLTGKIRNDSIFDAKFGNADSLFIAIQRIPHQFLFIKWGTKKIREVITTNNPHTKLYYSEYIQLE